MTRGHQVNMRPTSILIQDDDADVESTKLRMTIQEQNMEIQDLSLNLERAKWIIRYLEQRNK